MYFAKITESEPFGVTVTLAFAETTAEPLAEPLVDPLIDPLADPLAEIVGALVADEQPTPQQILIFPLEEIPPPETVDEAEATIPLVGHPGI